ncbi:MAG TPA: thioredoxin-disulfide reductase [Myxococcota bacterium]|jgi:thioredoxin reductase (NADPH)|nr:thioredoxin-disulfide reductase [Myxococcota bacterium]
MAEHHKLVIIGSGPAGLTAAIYAARADLVPLVLEGKQPGGQLTITTDVENYPGFPKGVLGPELMDIFRKQAQRFGAVTRWEIVTKVDLRAAPKRLWAETADGKEVEYTADAVVVSTGASAQYLGLPSEKELSGYGVSACATCDAPLFRNKRVVVVGGGDSAMEEANHLAKFCAQVVLVHRRDTLRASKIMEHRARNNPKISFVWNSVVEEVLGTRETGVTGVKVKNLKTGEVNEQKADGLFLAIGHHPNTDLFAGQLDMDAKGYLNVQSGSTRTNLVGVFAAGDVADSIYRQAVTAAGTGCMAALDAERWLASTQGH